MPACQFGECRVGQILSDFSCDRNPDVERFLKEQAIEFTKKNQSVTYLVFSNVDAELVGYFTIAKVFNGNFTYSFVNKLVNVLTSAISLIRTILFLMLGMKALNQHSVAVPIVDGIIGKYI